jgi:hypothetical protein
MGQVFRVHGEQGQHAVVAEQHWPTEERFSYISPWKMKRPAKIRMFCEI